MRRLINAVIFRRPYSPSGVNRRTPWVPREDFDLARTPLIAPCAPTGLKLTGWNTEADGTGDTLTPGGPLPVSWAEAATNRRQVYAQWGPSSATQPKIRRAAAFYESGSLAFAPGGRQRLDRLVSQIPQGADDVRVFIVGMSTAKATVNENLALARARAKKTAAYLEKSRIRGDYMVEVATQLIVDGSSGPLAAESGTKLLTPIRSSEGKPLTTASIVFNEPGSGS